MTTAYPYEPDSRLLGAVTDGVYAPREDSKLLIDVMDTTALALGAKVADLCTGSGVVAINAAVQGAARVAAFDICPKAVRCARANAQMHGAAVDVHLGSWARAAEFGPFDLVVSNPHTSRTIPTLPRCRRVWAPRVPGMPGLTDA